MLKTSFFSEVCRACYLNRKLFQNSLHNQVSHGRLDVRGRDVGAKAHIV